jgi:hypothetical protein
LTVIAPRSALYQLYPDVDWPKLLGKRGDLQRLDYDWSRQASAIHLPVLIVFADADAIRPAHIVKFFQLLGGGKGDAGLDGSAWPANQLAIMPAYALQHRILPSPRKSRGAVPRRFHARIEVRQANDRVE